MDRICENCKEDYDGKWNQRFCSPLCRKVNENKKSQEEWVNKKIWKPTQEHKRAFEFGYTERKPGFLRKFNAVRG